jgi:hypothetical protein
MKWNVSFLLAATVSIEVARVQDHLWPDMRKGTTSCEMRFFFYFSNCHHSKASRALGFWLGFFSSLGLLLHKSNVRSYNNPHNPSGEPPRKGVKQPFSNVIDVLARPAHTGNGRGSEFATSVVGWWKNIHTRFQIHSCYGSRDINVLKRRFGKCAKWSLFSYPVTFYREQCQSLNQKLVAIQLENVTLAKECQKLQKVNCIIMCI